MHRCSAARLAALAFPAILLALAAAPPGLARTSASNQDGEFVERAREHYRRVELELSQRDGSHLDPARRAARAALVRALAIYAEEGDFGRNPDFPGARVPYFVDRDGRRCAVAHLLHVTGEDSLVSRVARTSNHAFVAELADDPAFALWLDVVGLDLAEAARIQVPSGLGGPGGPAGPGGSGGSAPPPGSPGGGGSQPSTPGAPQPSAPGPARGGGAAPAAPAAASSGGPGSTAPLLALTGSESPWWVWWEMNKLEFMRPNRLALRGHAVTGYDFGVGLEPDLASAARGPLALRLVEELRHPSAEVRAAAVVALARLRGPDTVTFSRRLLGDPSVAVREHALLAIGAAGGPRAVDLLLAVAEHGSEAEGRQSAISPRARPIALVALGLARRQGEDTARRQGEDTARRQGGDPARRQGGDPARRAGLDADTQAAVLEALRKAARAGRDELALAAMLHQTLAPLAELAPIASVLAEDRGTRIQARARALETLRTRDDPQALAILSRALHGRGLDLRQSAALTLGELRHELALPTLKTAFELEKEPTTRGFALLAIGRRGGEGARAFLADVLEKERRGAGPWAALALGLLARADDDDAARLAVREGFAQVTSPEHRGAYLLALGIARDSEAVPLAAVELDSRNQLTRMHAALCLGMIGGGAAREALLERLEIERADLVRVGLVHALGAIGDPRDGARLVQTLGEFQSSELQAVMAVALAFHGSPEVVDGLLALCEEDRLSTAGRAAAWNALGLLLALEPGLQLAELSRQSNFALYPGWVLDLLQVTL